MITEIEAKDHIYKHLKNSALMSAVTGGLYKTVRPDNGTKEDVVINVIDSDIAQAQTVYLSVWVYVADNKRQSGDTVYYEENTKRLRTLTELSIEALRYGFIEGRYEFKMISQRIGTTQGEHVIQNRIRFKTANE